MTTLYRTPNLVIDRHEWHAAVLLNCGRVSLVYRWRPLCLKRVAWSTMRQWRGPKPKALCNRFWMFKSHIRKAAQSEQVRREAIAALKGPVPAAVAVNTGDNMKRRGDRAKTLLVLHAAA